MAPSADVTVAVVRSRPRWRWRPRPGTLGVLPRLSADRDLRWRWKKHRGKTCFFPGAQFTGRLARRTWQRAPSRAQLNYSSAIPLIRSRRVLRRECARRLRLRDAAAGPGPASSRCTRRHALPRSLTPAARPQVKLQSQSVSALGTTGFKGPIDATRQVGRLASPGWSRLALADPALTVPACLPADPAAGGHPGHLQRHGRPFCNRRAL
jgi:hypothetical protein